jgi:hypothetical protein
VSWQCLERKPSVLGSIFIRSTPRLAGLTAFDVPHEVVFILYFISRFFAVTLFERANETMLI